MRTAVLYLILIPLFFSYKGNAQTKIYLTFPKGKGWQTGREVWGIVYPTDSNLVNFTRFSGGYGNFHPSDYHFSINRYAPDGVYEIYVNDTISLRGTLKDGEKEGVWTEYYRDTISKYREMTWKAGIKHGKGFTYFKNGAIRYQWKYIEGLQHGISLSFDKNGKLQYKSYYEHGSNIRTEILDENGSVIRIDYPPVVDE